MGSAVHELLLLLLLISIGGRLGVLSSEGHSCPRYLLLLAVWQCLFNVLCQFPQIRTLARLLSSGVVVEVEIAYLLQLEQTRRVVRVSSCCVQGDLSILPSLYIVCTTGPSLHWSRERVHCA
jgi:hypothetical protein